MSRLGKFLTRCRIPEPVVPRRIVDVWLATGAVPVAHMVADLDMIDADAPRKWGPQGPRYGALGVRSKRSSRTRGMLSTSADGRPAPSRRTRRITLPA